MQNTLCQVVRLAMLIASICCPLPHTTAVVLQLIDKAQSCSHNVGIVQQLHPCHPQLQGRNRGRSKAMLIRQLSDKEEEDEGS